MLTKLVNFIFGYYIVLINNGNISRFLNICKSNSIEFMNIDVKDKNICVKIKEKQYNAMLKYAKKAGVDMKIVKKSGLKHFFYTHRKRKVFFLFFIGFFISIWISSLYIWNIEVECNEIYSDVQIEKYIKDNFVPIGTKIKDVDCNELEKCLREEFDKIAWVSCQIKGTKLIVEFSETVETNKLKKSDNPCNIVAIKDAVITKIITDNGVAVINTGDEVKKNDILISGAINIKNEYDEDITTEYVAAFGYVYGVVEHYYTDEFPLDTYEKKYTGKSEKKKYINIFGHNIGLPYFFQKKYNQYDTITEYNSLKIFGYDILPVEFITKNKMEYEVSKVHYDEKEAVELANKRLEIYIENLRKKGVEILENNVKIEVVNGVLKASGNLVIEELIGMPCDINLFNQGEIP